LLKESKAFKSNIEYVNKINNIKQEDIVMLFLQKGIDRIIPGLNLLIEFVNAHVV